jgi:hypothetical protein
MIFFSMITPPKTFGSEGRETTFFKSSQVKSRNTLSSRLSLSSNHRVVLPWCAQALALSYQWRKLTVEVFNGSLNSFAVHHFVRNLLRQKC